MTAHAMVMSVGATKHIGFTQFMTGKCCYDSKLFRTVVAMSYGKRGDRVCSEAAELAHYIILPVSSDNGKRSDRL